MENLIENSLTTIKKQLQRYLNTAFKDLNLKSSEIIFLRILNTDEKTSQIELARKLDCDKAHIHRITNKLLDKDLIYFPDNYISKTKNLILELTQKGKKIIYQINKTMEHWICEIKKGIDEVDLKNCKKVIERLITNASKIKLENDND